MVLGNLPAGLADWAANLDSAPALEEDHLKVFLLAYRVEEKSPRTLQWVWEAVTDFDRFLKGQQLPRESKAIKSLHIRLYLAHLQERGLAPSTRNNRYRALHLFFKWLVGEGPIEKTPFANISPPRVPRTLVPIFTREHIDSLLALCPPTTFLVTRDRALVFILLGTGIRLEEATRLRLGDVDLAHECVRVIGKGAKERKVYLSKVILKALLRYMAFRKPEPEALWLSEERRPLTKRGIQQILRKLGRRSGVTGVRVSAHTFRHTFAVNFLRAGGTLRHLQEVLGHANMDALEFYLRMVDNEDAMEAHKHLDPLAKMGVS